MKTAFIIDANLPLNVPVWSGEDYVFVLRINPSWDDEEIWKYAKGANLIIVTKDKDFIVKQMITGAPPKVIHVKFGNLKLNDFINRIETVWPDVKRLITSHNTVNIYSDKLEAIK